MSVRLEQALRQEREAEVNAVKVLRREYKRGADVSWKRRHEIHFGTVIRHGEGTRIKVRNRYTNKEYWICAYSIVDAM